LPYSWAVPEENYTEKELEGGEPAPAPDSGELPWSGVTQLLILAKICSELIDAKPEEAEDEGDTGAQDFDPGVGIHREAAGLARTARTQTAAGVGSSGGDVGELPSTGGGGEK
jgi:hypothetical protein